MENFCGCQKLFNNKRRHSVLLTGVLQRWYGREILNCLSFSLAIFVQKRRKILKWEIYTCFKVMQEVNSAPNLKISELWNEMLQDLWRVGVQWMCILRNDLHFNEVYYTWEAIAWFSFLSSDFDCVWLSKRAHYIKEIIIQLCRLIWWPPIYAVLLKAIGPAVSGIQSGNYLWERDSGFQLAVQRAFFQKKKKN